MLVPVRDDQEYRILANPTSSRPGSGEEIIFRGRGESAGLEEAFGDLSIRRKEDNDEKNVVGKGDFIDDNTWGTGSSKRSRVPKPCRHFPIKKSGQHSSNDSVDVRPLIGRFWRLTASRVRIQAG